MIPLPASELATIRSHFAALGESVNGCRLVYLDSAATSQKPECVLNAITDYYRRCNANVHRAVHTLSARATEGYESARRRVAAFLNAKADGTIFTRGTTEAINLLANSLVDFVVKPGDVILLTEMEHHANLIPWQIASRRTGAKLQFIPVTPDGQLDLAVAKSIFEKESGRVRITSFTHISNTLGTINPAKQLAEIAHQHGSLVVLDAAQSVGHMPVDFADLDVDFLVFSGHKMCAPTGIGALIGKPNLLSQLPPWQGGGEMILSVKYDSATFKESPARFEAGTPNIEGAFALHTAIDYLESIGLERIHRHTCYLATEARRRIAQIQGFSTLGPDGERGALVSFTHPDIHPHDLTGFADQKGVALRGGHHCNQPLMRKLGLPATTRASFQFYNAPEEIDSLIETLEKAVRFFA
jgi:cysteine desulfurase / selenocysteine lyase